MKFCFVFLACLAISFYSISQHTIPQNPNVTDAKGLRQGRWTLLYDAKQEPVRNYDSAKHYRLIEYFNDKPIGITKDYYSTGQVQREGKLLSDRPEEIRDGITTSYFENGKIDAVETYHKGKKVKEVSYNLDGSKATERWLSVYIRAKIAYKALAYDSAQYLYERAIILAAQKYGKEDVRYANSIEGLGEVNFSKSDYVKAIPLFEQALVIRKLVLSENHPDYITSLQNIGDAYKQIGAYDKALDFFYQALILMNRTRGNRSKEYADLINLIGLTFTLNGKYEKADSIQQIARSLRKSILGQDHPDYAESLNNLAYVYYFQGHYAKSGKLIQESLDIKSRLGGKNNLDYVSGLNNLAALYTLEGNYTKAIALFEQAMSITEKLSGKYDSDYAHFLHNLATLYYLRGQYVKAEGLFHQALEIRKRTIGENSPLYAESLYELANVYMMQGNYVRAERLQLQALDIRAKTLGREHTAYGESLLKLAAIQSEKGNYRQAEGLYLESLEIFEKMLGKEHITYAMSLNYLAALYFKQGFAAKAEPLFKQVASIREKAVANYHSKSEVKNSLANLYAYQGDVVKAETFYRECLAINEKTLDKDDPDWAISLLSMARFYMNTNRMDKAEPYFIRGIQNQIRQIENYFPAMSEYEKEVFFNTLRKNFEIFNSFAMWRQVENPHILSEMYNNQLSTKALLFNINNRIRNKVFASRDSALIEIYNTWQGKKDVLSKAYQMSSEQRVKRSVNLAAMEDEINALEKEISSKANVFFSVKERKVVTWKDVQKTLKKGEAAAELIRFRNYGIIKNVVDSSQQTHPQHAAHGLTDTIYYAVLIITSQSKLPELVLLKNGKDLETLYIKAYKNFIQFKIADTASYSQFWQPIAEVLKAQKIQKIYLSPDAVYNSINLGTLQNSRTSKYASEEFDIQLVTNTKDLVSRSEKIKINQSKAALFGYPDYLLKDTTDIHLHRDRSLFPVSIDSIQRNFAGGKITRLPGTQKEVISVNDLLISEHFQTNLYTDRLATEDELRKISGPTILHIATHGFFLEDIRRSGEQQSFAGFDTEKIADNPLLRSGLLLAGSQKALDGTIDSNFEDGIFTAYEAMNLNLDDTDLVVLSACETGLGEIRNGEGVYGLQRAFQTAGAKSVLMSLWKVDDTATQELMTSFYKNWLKSGDKREAFKKAQTTVRKKYPHPYYWGAFVLVGE